MKRARKSELQAQRVVINAGGTKLTTAMATIQHSSYLAGLVDVEAEEDAELFLDRDPEVFACLLRLMRQQPHIVGLMPREPLLCASIIAEADYFGFEGLLTHVKVEAYYNSRVPEEDYPTFVRPAKADGEAYLDYSNRVREAIRGHKEQCNAIDVLFKDWDEGHALSRFDAVYGDIGTALRSGVLPKYFLERKPPKPPPSKKIIQVMPADATTWFLLGDIYDAKYGHKDDYGPMMEMEAVVAMPARVRRVASQALVENEDGHRWLEPIINLTAPDLQELLDDGSNYHLEGLYYGVNIVSNTSLAGILGGRANRSLLASDWLETIPSIRQFRDLWTCLHVADSAPREFGFKEFNE